MAKMLKTVSKSNDSLVFDCVSSEKWR